MKIGGLLSQKRTLSFEVYPPKPDQPMAGLTETLSHLYDLQPDFISCTYGAGGGNRSRNLAVCEGIQAAGRTMVLSHYTCVGGTREDIRAQMAAYRALGIENILALRGDFPAGFAGTQGDFAHATDLLAFLKAEYPGFCFGAACYPETHARAASPESDLAYLKEKQDMGAEFCIAQLCFDPAAFARFLDRARNAGITLPVLAGVMPALNAQRVLDMTAANGCTVPADLRALIERYGGDAEAFRAAGVDYTAALADRFLGLDVGGLHLYTMNGYRYVTKIVAQSCALLK